MINACKLLIILVMVVNAHAAKPGRGSQIERSHNFSRGLKALWLINEAASGDIRDLTGSGHDGSRSSTSITWGSGAYGSTLEFDGSTDYVTCGSDDFRVTDGLTLVCLARCDGHTDSYPRLVGSEGDWTMIISSFDGNLYFFGSGVDSALSNVVSNDWRDGDWHLFAITYDGANVRGYVDGDEVGYVAKTGDLDTNGAVTIGGRTTGLRTLLGGVAMAAIYDRALTQNDIRHLTRDPFQMIDVDSTNDIVAAAAQAAGTPAPIFHYYRRMMSGLLFVMPCSLWLLSRRRQAA